MSRDSALGVIEDTLCWRWSLLSYEGVPLALAPSFNFRFYCFMEQDSKTKYYDLLVSTPFAYEPYRLYRMHSQSRLLKVRNDGTLKGPESINLKPKEGVVNINLWRCFHPKRSIEFEQVNLLSRHVSCCLDFSAEHLWNHLSLQEQSLTFCIQSIGCDFS